MIVVVWVVVGFALLLFELHHLAFYAMFGAAGAFAAAVTAWILPEAYVVQVLLAVVVAFLGAGTLRPWMSRAFHHRQGEHVARGVHGGLLGQEAVTLDEVGGANSVGHVRLAGERWLAITGGAPIPASTTVIVTAVEGTTLMVWPVDEIGGAMPSLGIGSEP